MMALARSKSASGGTTGAGCGGSAQYWSGASVASCASSYWLVMLPSLAISGSRSWVTTPELRARRRVHRPFWGDVIRGWLVWALALDRHLVAAPTPQPECHVGHKAHMPVMIRSSMSKTLLYPEQGRT